MKEFAMNQLRRFDPSSEFRTMQGLVDRMFNDSFFLRPERRETSNVENLALDIYEKDGHMILKAAVPGVDPADVDVSIHDDVLTVRGETKSEDEVENGDYHRREYRYGRFSRSVRLPVGLQTDKTEAAFDKGMLRITIPLPEETKPRRIQVQVQ